MSRAFYTDRRIDREVWEDTLTIKSPGKFEGEGRYIPVMWSKYLNGEAKSDDGVIVAVFVSDEDRAHFPEISERFVIRFRENNDGFVIEV